MANKLDQYPAGYPPYKNGLYAVDNGNTQTAIFLNPGGVMRDLWGIPDMVVVQG